MKKLVVLDFDGVIHDHSVGWEGIEKTPGPVVTGAAAYLAELLETGGLSVAVFSSRSRFTSGRTAMARFVLNALKNEFGNDKGKKLAAKVLYPYNKPSAHVFIDDRAITFAGKFPAIGEIINFKTWYE